MTHMIETLVVVVVGLLKKHAQLQTKLGALSFLAARPRSHRVPLYHGVMELWICFHWGVIQ